MFLSSPFCNTVFFYSTDTDGELYIDFRDFESCKFKGLKATFKRVSTPSTISDDEKEPLRTHWLWYWRDQKYIWRLFEVGVQVYKKPI